MDNRQRSRARSSQRDSYDIDEQTSNGRSERPSRVAKYHDPENVHEPWHAPERPQKRSSVGRVIIGVAILAVVLIAVSAVTAGVLGAQREAGTGITAGQPVTFEVAEGDSTRTIAQGLEDKGVITNARSFRKLASELGMDAQLKVGVYNLLTGMSDQSVLDMLVAGPEIETITITIPEGWRIEQIAKRYEEQAGIPADEFIALAKGGASQFVDRHPYLADAHDGKLEGFLFPKTYTIKPGANAADVIEMMLSQFDTELQQVDMAAAEARGLSVNDVVTIASIIERETKLAEERELVSSVIENRLDIGMPLQMCSTVVYVLDRHEMRLTTAETKTKSPYNTYINKGLPPGPVANPGLASLQAAVAPADTDYIYFVLTSKEGSHTFASNNADFLAAKQHSKDVLGE